MTQSQLHHLLVISDKVSSWPMFPVIMDNNKMPCPSPEVPLACYPCNLVQKRIHTGGEKWKKVSSRKLCYVWKRGQS